MKTLDFRVPFGVFCALPTLNAVWTEKWNTQNKTQSDTA
jgi:hypothetical protein